MHIQINKDISFVWYFLWILQAIGQMLLSVLQRKQALKWGENLFFFLLAVGVLGEATERNETPMDNSLKHIRALLESLLDGGEQEKCEKPQLGSCEIKENPIILFDKRTEEK